MRRRVLHIPYSEAAKVSRDVPSRPDLSDQTAAAAYVAELSSELAAIARRHGLETLSYILDMARLEAENASHSGGDGKS